jgi:DNA-binding IclR family transcriptional regulator
MTLRALGAAVDGAHFRLLCELEPDVPVGLDELAGRLALPRLAVAERLSALSQLGLAARDVERDGALGTAAGSGIVALIRTLSERLGGRLGQELPGLLGCAEGGR